MASDNIFLTAYIPHCCYLQAYSI